MSRKFAILIFTKNLPSLAIHIQVENKNVLSYLLKMRRGEGGAGGGGGGTRSLELLKISMSIVYYLLPDEMGNYCRIFTNQIECVSKLGVLEFRRSLRLETA